jgi:hypothetical protein
MGGSGAEQMPELGIQSAETGPGGIIAPANAAGDQWFPPPENGEQRGVDLHPECREARHRTTGWQEGPADSDRPGVKDIEAVRGQMTCRECDVGDSHAIDSV